MWSQGYDPFGSMVLSTAVAAIPVVVLLGAIGILEVRAHIAAMLGLAAAFVVAVLGFGMPAQMAAMAALYGAGFGLLPIGWIILNVIFLYQLAKESGEFEVLQRSIATISDDRRLQLLFIAFCLGAFFEGAAGFGTPVAVTAAMLIGLGFRPLAASGLSLIANTAPVAYGGLGTPVIALAAVTGLDLHELSGMIGRQLPFFSLIVPFWLMVAFVGWRKTIEIWPPILVAGLSFAISQYLVSNFHGPWLVDVVAAIVSMASLALFLRVWRPANPMTSMPEPQPAESATAETAPDAVPDTFHAFRRAWTPWLVLSVLVFLWGAPMVHTSLDGIWSAKVAVAGLNGLVQKMPPVVTVPHIESAEFNLNVLSATGTGILVAAIISGLFLGYRPMALARLYARTIYLVRYSLLTISCMLAIGFITRYSGSDATLGLALANSGRSYPFFGPLIGWLGVALTAVRHLVERSLRRIAANDRRAYQSGADGRGEQFGRRHGQDDRRAVDRSRLDCDQMVRPRGLDSALCVLPFRGTRRACRSAGLRPSLSLAANSTCSLTAKGELIL